MTRSLGTPAQRHYLTEIVAAGPGADRRARATRDRLISQVEERRNPRTNATVDQLIERYLDQFDGAASTLTLYRGYVREQALSGCSSPPTPSCSPEHPTAAHSLPLVG